MPILLTLIILKTTDLNIIDFKQQLYQKTKENIVLFPVNNMQQLSI